ncbi:ATP11-domain-containing protein [Mytilinidion resinicola]|uniref:ATP11-domain-containing protein n=1 Tax=Mytilinidion resinicola TaxID=574789 RepID=A0A6A6YMY7_9PEZI|nr:ATP11-domain-containing protein [Mytilinidion resinicola]KAF2810150.1 ATP11-domain-containing protein [Mytilinidion resinicola]
MASIRQPAIRHVFRPLLNPRICQRRWAQVHDVRFLATHGAQERVIAKYHEKLDRKAKEEGLRDISELKQAYKDKIEDLRKQAAVPGATAPLELDTSSTSTGSPFPSPPPPPPPPGPKTQSSTPSSPPPGLKTLSSFIDVPKTLELPPKEIETIWRLRHASNPDSLSFNLPHDTWRIIAQTADKHPQFILPLPREGQGAEIHFLQWAQPAPHTTTLLFTHLAEYKLRGEYSTPHTTVSFHQELADPKGLILGHGSVLPDRGVSVDEAKWLLMCLQKFYGMQAKESTERKKLLEQFSSGDGNFRVEALIEEAEKIV